MLIYIQRNRCEIESDVAMGIVFIFDEDLRLFKNEKKKNGIRKRFKDTRAKFIMFE